MRTKYSIGLAALLAAAAFAERPCPPELAATAVRVAQMRGLSASFGPPCRWVGADAVRAELDHKLRRDLPVPPELFLQALARIGLVDGVPAALYPRLLDFYGTQVLGFYEPTDNVMVLVDNPAAGAETAPMIWAHELAHAAQELRFRLPSRLLDMASNGDAQRAASAVAEGDAMLVMFLLGAAPDANDDALARAEDTLRVQAEATAPPPGLPHYFVADLVFPYTAGFSAVLRAYRRNRWAGVDALLATPPSSTAALLHPARLAPGRPFGDTDLPPVPRGWQEVLTDTLGEWGLAFLLGRRLPQREAAERAAAWDADRFRFIRDTTNPERWALAWRLRCRTAEGCQKLEEALRRELPSLLAALPSERRQPRITYKQRPRELEIRADWP